MVAEAELALEIEQGKNDPNTHDRTLPFAFAKRHGVLIQRIFLVIVYKYQYINMV